MNAATQFDTIRTGRGTNEWAEVTENICRGCANNCLYCYAAHNAARFKLRARGEWSVEELTQRAEMASYPARAGVIMFPSSHDISPYNVEAYIRVALLMLEKGNRLLIVSKPRLECVRRLIAAFEPYREQILFRFSITSTCEEISRIWEPGAPDPDERIRCLAMAACAGYRTSVSIEPMLGGVYGTIAVVGAVRRWVNETIWIGKMNKPRLRVDLRGGQNAERVARIEHLQEDGEIFRLYLKYKDDPMVRWKDSIKDVLSQYGIVI